MKKTLFAILILVVLFGILGFSSLSKSAMICTPPSCYIYQTATYTPWPQPTPCGYWKEMPIACTPYLHKQPQTPFVTSTRFPLAPTKAPIHRPTLRLPPYI